MKYLFILWMAFAAFSTIQADTLDYDITFEVKGIKNDNAILAYYYMDKKYVKDTVVFNDQGIGRIEGEKLIEEGVYLLAFPSKQLRYFELILGGEASFEMKTDTVDFINNMTVSGSVENKLFYDYMRFMIQMGETAGPLRSAAQQTPKESGEYAAIEKQLQEIDQKVKDSRNKMFAEHPDAFYTKLVKAMIEPEIPENPNPADSSFAYRYYHDHYFDNIDFSDARMARTPFFLKKVLTYLDDYTIPLPDSINAAAEAIIEKSRSNEEIFQVCLVGIFNKYAKSKVMAHELVYVNLAKKYYLSGIADWVSEEQLQTFRDRITKMEPTLLGKIAPEIIISDYNNQPRKLHEIAEAHDYTILMFWNSDCGHCQKMVPKMKDIYQSELAELCDIAVFAISTEQETDEWKSFIQEHQLTTEGWIHAHDPYGRNPFRALYDIESTPLVLVLNKEQKIMAKRIGIEDIKGLIEFDLSKKN